MFECHAMEYFTGDSSAHYLQEMTEPTQYHQTSGLLVVMRALQAPLGPLSKPATGSRIFDAATDRLNAPSTARCSYYRSILFCNLYSN